MPEPVEFPERDADPDEDLRPPDISHAEMDALIAMQAWDAAERNEP